MKRLLAGVALAALCAGLVWWSLGGERAPDAVGDPRFATTTAQGADARLEPAPSRDAHASELTAAEVAPAAAREEVGRAAPDEAVRATDLVVVVVDPTGTPRADIPLRLDSRPDVADPGTGPEPQLSDAQGRAVFRQLRARVAAYPTAWTLHADLPFEQQPSLQLDDAALDEPMVRFVLPPGGELAVRVRELDGAAAPDGSTLRLQLVHAHERNEPDLTGPQWRIAVDSGAARFPWVQLDTDWDLAAWRPSGTEPTRLRVRGPDALGERVACELVFGSDQPVVGFRVLGPAGQPLPRVAIELARGSIFGALEKTALQTDDAGRFVIDGRLNLFGGAGSFTVTHTPSDGAMWMGRASLPAMRVPGWNDGGDIRLEAEPLLVAGRVVDTIGAPVADAEVVAGDDAHWFLGEPRSVRGRSDARGAFELRGLWSEERFRVRARTPGASSPATEVSQGATDVVLVLSPRYALSGTLLLDPGIDPSSIRFARVEAGGTRAELERVRRWPIAFDLGNGTQAAAPDPNRFELEPIEGGMFDFVCSMDGFALARIQRLAVRSDLDLGVLDLRGKVSLVEIELVGDGELSGLSGGYTWWPSGSDEQRQSSFDGTLVRIASPRVPIDVELRPSGYRSALLEQVRGRREHRLTAPLHVRLVLRTAGALPPPPYRFDCELYQRGNPTSQPDGARWFTPERNEIRCLVASPGRHEVRWHLERIVEGDGFGGAVGSHVLDEHWTSIEVRDVPEEQVFDVPLDAAALAELVREPPW